MGNALVIFKIFPEGPEDVGKVEKALRVLKEGQVKDIRREPIAFGLEAIRVGIVIPDKQEGAMEKLENAVRNIKGISQVDVEGVTLL